MERGGGVGPGPDGEHGALDAGDGEAVGEACEEDVKMAGVEEAGGFCGEFARVCSDGRGADVGVRSGKGVLGEGDEALAVEVKDGRGVGRDAARC